MKETNSVALSVIVPIFNAEHYIHRCIESVLAQTRQDFEILLINDGSSDNSCEVCRAYACKDQRISLYNKPNGGVGSARNVGLDMAKGKYCLFLDADDWIEDGCVDSCIREMEEKHLDILQFGYQRIDDDGRTWGKTSFLSNVMGLESYIDSGHYNLCVAGSILRLQIIKDGSIRFDEAMKLAEDQMFMIEYISYCQRLEYVPQCYYYYYCNTISASTTPKTQDMLYSLERLEVVKSDYPLFYHKIKKLQINYFLANILSNHDLSSKAFNDSYNKYYVEGYLDASTPKILRLYRAVLPFLGKYVSYGLIKCLSSIRRCFQ